MRLSLDEAMYEDRLRLGLSARWFAKWGTDGTATWLAAAAKTPPVKTLKAMGVEQRHVQSVTREARTFVRDVRRLRRSRDRLRLLEARAAQTLRRFRAVAFGAEDPHLLMWVNSILEWHAQVRWSSLLPGDHVEELTVVNATLELYARPGILVSVEPGDPILAVTVEWDNGSKETLVASSGRLLLRRFEEIDDLPVVQTGRAARRRRRELLRLREDLVKGSLHPGEKILAHTAAGTTVHSLLDRTVERAKPVVLYATTERVLWAGVDGSELYRPVSLGDDGHVRWINYGAFLDFVAASAEEGPRGPIPSSGFGFIALSADQAAELPTGVAEGLASAGELRIWAMEVTGSDQETARLVELTRIVSGAEFFQFFSFPVWGPPAEDLVKEVCRQNAAAIF